MERPRTRYARSGDVNIAYQESGEGAPIDLVWAPGTASHLDLDIDWDAPDDLWFLGRLHAYCRLIGFDKRGTGLSDRSTARRLARGAHRRHPRRDGRCRRASAP